MIRKLGLAFLALLVILIFTLSWAPYGIKVWVEREHTDLTVQDVQIKWGHVLFKKVLIKRPDVTGRLDTVRVTWSQDVRIVGGTIDVRPGPENQIEMSGSGSGSGSVTGQDLQINVTRQDLTARLERASFDSHRVWFKRASIQYRQYGATIRDGSIERVGHTIKANHTEIVLDLPIRIPRLDRQVTLSLWDLAVSPADRTARFKTLVIDRTKNSPVSFLGSDGRVWLDPQALHITLVSADVQHPWISPGLITFKNLAVVVPSTILRGSKDKILVRLGPVQIQVEPWLMHIQGHASCNEWIQAMPEPLPSALSQAGEHFRGELSFEVRQLPVPHFGSTNSCRFDCSEEPIASLKKELIRYQAYDQKNRMFERVTGRGAASWTSIQDLPPHIPQAFITMEDPGFLNHRGIIPQALENSLKDNLQIGRFFRGGSTISMQLAKNLWLKREKTIGRKAQEALLTLALESCLTKSEILELYLNVVEMGPDLYGIGPASQHYFNKDASQLEPEQAFYLASILPRPRRALAPDQGGLGRVRRLMTTLASRGLITEDLIPVQESEVDQVGWDTE